MNIQEVGIKKQRAIVLPESEAIASPSIVVQLQAEAMKLGFIFTQPAAEALAKHIEVYPQVFNTLNELVGANLDWKPFYSGFPQEVLDMSECELFFNALSHYISNGEWRPEDKLSKYVPTFEEVSYKKIGLISHECFMGIFTSLLGSNGALTPMDKELLKQFIDTYDEQCLIKHMPENIPFKENLCQFIAETFNAGYLEMSNMGVKTTTDVLRVACHLSGGDVTLTKNTKFKLNNRQRKFIVGLLEPLIKEEDVARHERQWVKLFHCLHIGSFTNAVKTNQIAKLARDGKCKSFNSLVETCIFNKDGSALISLLDKRGGDFARRLDDVLRDFSDSDVMADEIISRFLHSANKVDTRLLLQVMNHFRYRNSRNSRIAIPKGNVARAMILDKTKHISDKYVDQLVAGIKFIIESRFSLLEDMGNVYIDVSLTKAPVQLAMRNAADGLLVMQRGTRLPMGDKDILRFFINWEGNDIDLSAVFLTKDRKFHSTISYYNLRENNGYEAVHSGDITYAPPGSGACEFIDIDLSSIKDKSIRYIAMDVRVYSGANFKGQVANAGWMTRTKIGRNGEKFDARTVEQRIAIENESKNCMVALFDIEDREVIWLDLAGSAHEMGSGNNVHNNLASINDLVEAAIELKQPTLYELFHMHAENRGTIVEDRENADVVFDAEMILKYDKVLSEYVV